MHKYKTSIVSCKILDITDHHIKCEFNGKIGFCQKDQVSDFPIKNIKTFFSTYPRYKFKITGIDPKNNYVLSYKLAHPQLVLNKRKIIPTAHHYITLKNYLYSLISGDEDATKNNKR